MNRRRCARQSPMRKKPPAASRPPPGSSPVWRHRTRHPRGPRHRSGSDRPDTAQRRADGRRPCRRREEHRSVLRRDASAAESLPVALPLIELLPTGGLRRGSTVSVVGSTTLMLALLVEAMKAGSWAAVAGLPGLGMAAAAELGIDLDRIALVSHLGTEAVAVVSALIDGFDLVVLGPGAVQGLQPQVARRLAGRVRNRGAVLLTVGTWPDTDLQLRVSNRRWHGVDADGFGKLRFRDIVATSRGRGAAARPRTVMLQLPGLGGSIGAGAPPAQHRPAETSECRGA